MRASAVARDPLRSRANVVAPALTLLCGALLLFVSFRAIGPFIGSFLWAIVLTVTAWPLAGPVRLRLGVSHRLAAALIGAAYFVVLAVPLIYLSAAVGTLLQDIGSLLQRVSLTGLPDPPPFLAHLPLIGRRLAKLWQNDARNLPNLLTQSESVLLIGGKLVLGQVTDLFTAIGELIFGIGLSIQMLAAGRAVPVTVRRLAVLVAGRPGLRAIEATRGAIIAVALWLVGSALVEAAFSGIAFWAAGVPSASILAFLCYLLRVLQIGPWIIWAGAVLWLWWSATGPWPAVMLMVCLGIVVGLKVRLLNPFLKRHRPEVPPALMFFAVLGGLMNWGFTGMFLGAASVAVVWSLMLNWLRARPVVSLASADR